jgi:ankyrin repeat protein
MGATHSRAEHAQPALHRAARRGEHDAIRTLCASGALAMFHVTTAGAARAMAEAGLDLDEPARGGMTALRDAIDIGDRVRAEALLAAGAEPNLSWDRGFTLFMSACGSASRDLVIIRMLVEHGADPHAVTELGWNAFHAAIDVNGVEGTNLTTSPPSLATCPSYASISRSAMLAAGRRSTVQVPSAPRSRSTYFARWERDRADANDASAHHDWPAMPARVSRRRIRRIQRRNIVDRHGASDDHQLVDRADDVVVRRAETQRPDPRVEAKWCAEPSAGDA